MSLYILAIIQFLSFARAATSSTEFGIQRELWLGYTLQPYSSTVPQTLGGVSYISHENGTGSGYFTSWTPPSKSFANQNREVQIGILNGKAGASEFTSSVVQVTSEILAGVHLTLGLFLDVDTSEVWSLILGSASEEIAVLSSNQEREEPTVAATASTGLPQLKFIQGEISPKPFVNKPVVLSAEGKIEEPPADKTLLQKYWWVLLALTFVLLSGGGDSRQ